MLGSRKMYGLAQKCVINWILKNVWIQKNVWIGTEKCVEIQEGVEPHRIRKEAIQVFNPGLNPT